MDFTFSPEGLAAAEAAAGVLSGRTTTERLREVEAAGSRFDPDLWGRLGDAGLLTLTDPVDLGGEGLGPVELCQVLVEVGRTVAPVPLGTHGPVRLALAEHGSPRLRHTEPHHVLAAAVAEELDHLPRRPATTATPHGDGYRLDGTKVLVRAATVASLVAVTASAPDGVGVFLVDPARPGVTVEPQHTSDGDDPAVVRLESVEVGLEDVLGAVDGSAAARLADLLQVATCAEQLGVTEGALARTAAYARERHQFGRPIGSFQAVRHRLADGHIDLLGQRLTLWQAAWRLASGLPAAAEVAAAKLWAADAGHRIAHTAVHVHGGVGIDLDGETHRYFTAAKRWEHAWGGAGSQATDVGRTILDVT